MNPFPNSTDDLPPTVSTRQDWTLRQQLENACRQYIHAAFIRQANQQEDHSSFLSEESSSLGHLLNQCDWYVNTYNDHNTLVIQCPNLLTNWRILEKVLQFGSVLEPLAIGKIRICPPVNQGTPLEIRVDELSVYQE
jgi:hypothetical protein